VHEVAETTSRALSHLVLATAGFAKVSDGGKLGVDRRPVVPSIVEISHGFGGVFFLTKLDVDIADQMIAQVVAYVHLFHLPVFVLHLHEDIFEKVVVVLLHFDFGNGVRPFRRGGGILRIAITVLQDDSLREGGLVVEAGAGGPMTTRAYFKVKRTVDFVLFCAENGRQVFRHDSIYVYIWGQGRREGG